MSLETMTKLATYTVGAGGDSSVTFSNISQTYTDLKVVMSARSVTDTPACVATVQFNGDTGSNYAYKYIRGIGSAVDSSGASPTTSIYLFIIAASNATASTFSNSEMYIPNYVSANYKSVSIDALSENNATRADAVFTAGLWSNTAAITSIKLSEATGNFAQHSTFTLYGVKSMRTVVGNSIKATGGNIAFDGTYVTHTFNTTGTFIPTTNLLVDYLVVAGGGGGGNHSTNSTSLGAGGGGAKYAGNQTGGNGTAGVIYVLAGF